MVRGGRQYRPQGRRRRDDRARPARRRRDAEHGDVHAVQAAARQSLRRGQSARRHPRLLSLYRDGKLLLDETVTHEYTLAEVQPGLRGHARPSRNIRGVVLLEH